MTFSETLWLYGDILSALTLQSQGQEANGDFVISGISIDSRTIKKNNLFIALKGPNFDGHDYIEQAITKGACGVMIEASWHEAQDKKFECPQFIVDDTQKGLNDLASYRRAQMRGAKVIGVTGSLGKTSFCHSLAHLLQPIGKTYYMAGNFNNHIGLPLALAQAPIDCDYALFELGMNHPNEIRPLSKLLRPDIAVITTIAPCHIENFDSLYDIALAKAEIMDGMTENASIILPRDNIFYATLAQIAQEKGLVIKDFGRDSDADARFINYDVHYKDKNIISKLWFQYEKKDYNAIYGEITPEIAVLFAAFLPISDRLGINLDRIIKGLATLRPFQGRGDLLHIDCELQNTKTAVWIIDESYNASPLSMRSALRRLVNSPLLASRRIAVLGDMLELGKDEIHYHQALGHYVLWLDEQSHKDKNGNEIDEIWFIGPLMRHAYDVIDQKGNLPDDNINLLHRHFDNIETLLPHLPDLLLGEELLMVKGSRGVKTDLLIKDIMKN